MTTPAFHPLESRLHLAANLVEGGLPNDTSLVIHGRPGGLSDNIHLTVGVDTLQIIISGRHFVRDLRFVHSVRVKAGEGDDIVRVDGELFDVVLDGGPGADRLFGGSGNEILRGRRGTDLLDGGLGADTLSGGSGPHSYTADTVTYAHRTHPLNLSLNNKADDGEAAENDNILSDIENVEGGSGDDTITGDAANNFLFGHDGTDQIYGLAGNDFIDGGAGQDHLDAGPGDDRLSARDGTGEEVIGGDGKDDRAIADTDLGFWRNDDIQGVERVL